MESHALDTVAGLVAGRNAYVASPYGDADARRYDRYDAVLRMCGYLISAGVRAYSPIVYTHHIHEAGYTPPDGWYEYDLGMLGMFDVLLVCMLPGWEESLGVQKEIARAKSLRKPILYVRV